MKKILRNEAWADEPGIAYKKSDGKIIVNEKRKSLKKLDEFPMINWDYFETEKYFQKSYAGAHAINDGQVRVMPVVTARGCAHLNVLFVIMFFGMIHIDIEAPKILFLKSKEISHNLRQII